MLDAKKGIPHPVENRTEEGDGGRIANACKKKMRGQKRRPQRIPVEELYKREKIEPKAVHQSFSAMLKKIRRIGGGRKISEKGNLAVSRIRNFFPLLGIRKRKKRKSRQRGRVLRTIR